MSNIKSEQEINIMRQSGAILAKVHTELAKLIKPKMSSLELDQIAEKLILKHNAIPSFKGYNGFKGSICVSVNEEAVHGIPDKDIIFEQGDIVTIDCGVYYKGFHTDSANTFGIGSIKPEYAQFIESVRETLYLAIKMVKPGTRIGEISNFIETKTNKDGYYVLRELIGHGIGRKLHEPPQVPNYGKASQGAVLIPGMTICIEPIIAMGTRFIETLDDNWTVVTKDGSIACQQEHTVLVTQNGFEILTLRDDEKHLF